MLAEVRLGFSPALAKRSLLICNFILSAPLAAGRRGTMFSHSCDFRRSCCLNL